MFTITLNQGSKSIVLLGQADIYVSVACVFLSLFGWCNSVSTDNFAFQRQNCLSKLLLLVDGDICRKNMWGSCYLFHHCFMFCRVRKKWPGRHNVAWRVPIPISQHLSLRRTAQFSTEDRFLQSQVSSSSTSRLQIQLHVGGSKAIQGSFVIQ